MTEIIRGRQVEFFLTSLWKPQRVIAGVSDSTRQTTISQLTRSRGIEVCFSTEGTNIVRLTEEKLPSIVILDLASSEYDGFDCCHELEWHPDVTVFILYPDERKDLLKEAFGYGFDVPSEYSQLRERLTQLLDANYLPGHMPQKVRKWVE